MKIYLTTDTHFGHHKMMEYCNRPEGFEEIILNNLSKIKPDVLIHLGDFSLCGKDEYWNQRFMDIVKCKKWLIRGNHDKKTNQWYLEHGWDMVCEQFRDNYFGKIIMFSHKPVVWDGDYDINIHGHMHNSDHRQSEPQLSLIKNGYQKLLAIENIDYKPVNLEYFINNKKL
jgi:calcineurin-like phosphoesterase family protein